MPDESNVKNKPYSLEKERLIKKCFYQWVINTHGGFWERVADDVRYVTGVDIPAETLRQNIQPVSKKANKPARRFDDPKRLVALKDFLIKVNYLKEKDLQENQSADYIATIFSEFINNKASPNNSCMKQFNGIFSCERIGNDYTEYLQFQIDYLSNEKIVKVIETSTREYVDNNQIYDKIEHTGWGVCNQDGFYMFSLLNQEEASFKCYLILQANPSITSGQTINDFALFSYDGAWDGELQKTTTKIHDRSEKVEYSLPNKINDLCLFLTRQR